MLVYAIRPSITKMQQTCAASDGVHLEASYTLAHACVYLSFLFENAFFLHWFSWLL